MEKDEIKSFFLVQLIRLTREALKITKEKGIEPQMVNTIRENIRLILRCLGEV